MANI
jgi:mediator of RNA polymerase II transcription subunit 8